MVFKDYYKLLGLETPRVSIDEIKSAYRIAAKKYHPDLNVGDSLAEEKIKEYQNKKGFENYPNNFKIEKLKIYAPSKASKFYELWHEYMDKNGYDVITPIGVYGTFEEALAMKTKSLFYSKYKEHPNGFEIAEIKLDLDGWTEGFIPN